MSKLEKLTPEQEALMPIVRDEWIAIFNNNTTFNEESVKSGVNWLYKEAGFDPPKEIFIVASPQAAQRKAVELTGEDKEHEVCGYAKYSDAGWCAFYDFFARIGVLDNEKFNTYRDFMKNGVYYSIFFDEAAIVARPPVETHLNAEGLAHNAFGPSIRFSDGYCVYNLNGRRVPAKYYEEGFTFEDFVNADNEEDKAAICTLIKEREGDEALMKFLGAELVDEQTLKHNEGHSEVLRLYKTKKKYSFLSDRHGNENQPYCWSEMKCPSTGQVYLIENSADFTDAVEAAAWLRPTWVPQELTYLWPNFAN